VLTTIDRYVLGKLLATFFPAFAGLCFVFFLGASFRLLKVEDLSLGQVAMALPWVVPFLLPYLLPMAYLVTLTLVFGRMVADNEVLAFGALGIPQRALAWPACMLGLLLSCISLWLTTSLVPHCHQMRKEAEQAVFVQLFTLGEGQHLSRSFDSQGFDLYVRSYGPDGLEGIVVHHDVGDDPTRSRPVQVVAQRGRVAPGAEGEGLVLELDEVTATLQAEEEGIDRSNPLSYQPGDTPRPPPIRLHFQRYVQSIGQGKRRRIKASDYASADLRIMAAEADDRRALAAAAGGVVSTHQGQDRRGFSYRLELAMRAAVSTAPLLVTLLVAPLTFALRARSALIPFFFGLAATSAFFFAPLLLFRSLSEEYSVPWLAYASVGVTLTAAGLMAWAAGRR
jgi:lipopolysaccharide export LptBFGC system permease protein LptF